MKKLLSKKRPEKKLILSLAKTGGRGYKGRITVRHRGGGHRRFYRLIDFGQEKLGIPGNVLAIEYDPNRSAYIALVEYEDKDKGKEKRYILAPHNLAVKDKIICAETAEIKIGSRMKLKNILVGTIVFNLELEPNKGGKLVRSAGNGAKILAHEGKYCHLEMPSKEIRKISEECFASIGQVSHIEKRFEKLRKAGQVRLRGRRPKVRGTAMNPCDHPHGGGEGRSPIGLKYPKTPWGKPALGVRTRRKKYTDKLIIKRRHKKR